MTLKIQFNITHSAAADWLKERPQRMAEIEAIHAEQRAAIQRAIADGTLDRGRR